MISSILKWKFIRTNDIIENGYEDEVNEDDE